MKRAAHWRVNIMVTRHMTGMWLVCNICIHTYVFILSYMLRSRTVLVKYITWIKWTLFSAVSRQESSCFFSWKDR